MRGVHPYLTTPGAGLSIRHTGGGEERDGHEEHQADEREGCVGRQQGAEQLEGGQSREVGCRQRVVADAEAEVTYGGPPCGEGRHPAAPSGTTLFNL